MATNRQKTQAARARTSGERRRPRIDPVVHNVIENFDLREPDPRSALVAAVVARMLSKADRFNRDITALPIPATPELLAGKRLNWTMHALNEELEELVQAHRDGDVLEAADALIDLVYFALGRLVEMGVPAEAVMDEVQRANMGKQRGELSKRPGSMGHDAVKPAGWTAPDHSWLLAFTLADVEKARKWDAMSPVLRDIVELRQKKGQDYNAGPGLRDYFPLGHVSYLQMIHLKTTRLHSLLAVLSKGGKPNFEGLDDTLKDLLNYTTFYAEAVADGTAGNTMFGGVQ